MFRLKKKEANNVNFKQENRMKSHFFFWQQKHFLRMTSLDP
jgi:hypothetical protein